jgi:hypothetical protein
MRQGSSYFANSGVTSLNLSSYNDLEKFQEFYNVESKTPVDMAYLLTADRVVAMISLKGEWLGGYIINAKTPLRYLSFLNEAEIRVLERDQNVSQEDMVEITCIWVKPKLRRISAEARMQVYFESVSDAITTGKSVVIGGSVMLTVWKTFERILPKTLYFGRVGFHEEVKMGKIVFNSAIGAQESFLKELMPVET